MLENAVFWGAGCAIVWGFSDYIARLAGRSVGAMVATLAMMSGGAVLISVIMIVMAEPLDWRLDGLHWLLAIGAGTTIATVLFLFAVTHGPVSLAAPMVASYPAVAVPISVVLGARPGLVTWGAMAITLAGIWLVARTVLANGGEEPAISTAVRSGPRGVWPARETSLSTPNLAHSGGVRRARHARPPFSIFWPRYGARRICNRRQCCLYGSDRNARACFPARAGIEAAVGRRRARYLRRRYSGCVWLKAAQ